MAPRPPNRFERHPILTRIFGFCLVLGLLELAARLLTGLGVIPYQRYPTSQAPVFWDDLHEGFGVWHMPNASFRHQSACFDVELTSNADGACDKPRQKGSTAPRRAVVLGDSYVEGYGVGMEARFSQLLEDATGVEHLNFGTSGSFGTIQEWILYRDLARQFDHTDVMVFILPANDFSDNNPADFPPTRYRPYLRPAGTSFELFSSVSFANRQREFRDWGMTIKNGIDNASHLANYLRFAVREVKERARLSAPPPSPKEPSYARSTDQDRDILIHSLEQIIALAGARRVYLFTIPAEDDFAHAAARGTSDLPLPWELIKLASRHENVTYADLLPAFVRHARDNGLTHADYVLACDAHWNRLGHQVAADAIQRVVFAGGATSLKEPTP